MHITVNRIYSDDDATLSTVTVDGHAICFGLEDEFRAVKVSAETRIPAGQYNIGVRNVGGFHARYARKFPAFHKGMLQILDVPGFEYILIHIGNTDEDTAGCLLVGSGADMRGTPTVSRSTQAYKKLYKLVINEAAIGNLTIEFIDSDRG